MNADYSSFWIPSILMGFGIAIDVSLATLAKFRDKNIGWKNWTLPITVTHILFPAFGYYVFWGLSELFSWLAFILGTSGALLVSLFLYDAFCGWAGLSAKFSISEWMEEKFNQLDLVFPALWASILAVSWDALFSGPAKSAQAQAENWTSFEVLISFIIAGITVAAVAQFALLATNYLNRLVELQWGGTLRHQNKLVMFNVLGKYLEATVIGGFGVLALWNGITLGHGGDLYISILIAGQLFLLLFIWRWKTIKEEAMLEIN